MDLVRAFLMIVIPISVVGLLVWLGEVLFPSMPSKLKLLIRVVAVVLVVIYLLNHFNLYKLPLPS